WHAVYRQHKVPFVPLRRIRGITGRIDAQAKEIIPLDEDEVRQGVKELLEDGVEIIGICFMFSFFNPSHEQRAAQIAREVIKQMGKEIVLLLSSELVPIVRESSRVNVLVMQGYCAEPVRKQLFSIENSLKAQGYKYPLQQVLSYGTVANIRHPRIYEAVVSGPIGGMSGAAYLMKATGMTPNIVCTDLGGTSFDIGVITNGIVPMVREPEFERMKMNLTMIDIHSIGAGGGTYIRLHPISGQIRLGPDSAGGTPGPVSFDAGNEVSTIMDCDLLLGRLNPDYFLGGKRKLNTKKAYKNFKEQIADKLKMGVYEAAEAMIEMLNTEMHEAITAAMTGYDKSEYVILGYGGSGPLHLAGYAGDDSWKGVATVPWAAGFSAFGCACMDYSHRCHITAPAMIPPGAPDSLKVGVGQRLNGIWKELEEATIRDFEAEGVSREQVKFAHLIYLQYTGQMHDVEVHPPVNWINTAQDMDKVIKEFEKVYEAIYTMVAKVPEAGYTITEVAVIGTAPKIKPHISKLELKGKKPPEKAYKRTQDVYFKGKWRENNIYEMDALLPGNEVEGPAILEAPSTTLVVPADQKARIDEYRVIWLERK
ncbi:MAG: hydantoinase/oxoprolinase family protein, partial [Dehalococcoidia bacterium]